MFRLCNRAIVGLFNRDHQIDYIIGGFLGGWGGRDLALLNNLVMARLQCRNM